MSRRSADLQLIIDKKNTPISVVSGLPEIAADTDTASKESAISALQQAAER